MSTPRVKFDPTDTMYIQGFDDFGCTAVMYEATSNSFKMGGRFAAQPDFWVFVLFNRDDQFEHPAFAYLPHGDLSGVVVEFDIQSTGVQHFESLKFPWYDWKTLNVQFADGSTATKKFIDIATPPGGRTGASTTFTLNGGTVTPFDRVTLWVYNRAIDYIVPNPAESSPGVPLTLTDICAAVASQFNAIDWTVQGAGVNLVASASGVNLTITAIPGDDANSITMYELHKNSNLFWAASGGSTPAIASALTGGSSDAVSWHVTIDFDALGWTSEIQKLWITFAAKLTIGGVYTVTELEVIVSNIVVTGANASLQAAIKNSVRIEETSSWVTKVGFWEPAPVGFWSQGFAIRAAATAAKVVIESHCGDTHDLYVGTRIDTDCGIASVVIDGGSPVAFDFYGSTSIVRRKIASGLSSGTHKIEIIVTGTKNASSAGYYLYFDFLDCVIAGDPTDLPDNGIGVATDWDTAHGIARSPTALIKSIMRQGFRRLNHYSGVFFWAQRREIGATYPSVVITFGGTWADGDSAFITIGGISIGKSVFVFFDGVSYTGDDSTTIAAHFAYYINAIFVGVRATAVANVLTITTRGTAALWQFSFSNSVVSAAGTAGHTGSLNSGAVAGVWQIDSSITPVLNNAYNKFHSDLFTVCLANAIRVVTSFSQELVNTEDGVDTWVMRYPDNTLVQTATGLGSLFSNHCAFSTVVFNYLKQAYAECVGLMDAVGAPLEIQNGEVLWWYQANASGMAFYDAFTVAVAAFAGITLHTFLTPNDDPNDDITTANFLRNMLKDYVAAIHTYVDGLYPGTIWQWLSAGDVTDLPTRRLNYYVSTPTQWQIKAGSGFDSILREGFQFGGIDHDIKNATRNALVPVDSWSWDRSDCSYLVGQFYPNWPWEREYLNVANLQLEKILIWALDQYDLMGRTIPQYPKFSQMLLR